MSKRVHTQLATDTFVGTGAAVNVNLGFKPALLIIVNETDGTTMWFAIDGLADGKAYQIDTALSLLASNGITLGRSGFTAGSSVSVNTKTMRFFAF